MKSGNLYFLEPSGPLQASNGTALPLPSLSWLSNSSILVSRQCESFRTLDQSFLVKNQACSCVSMGSLAAPTFGYLELRKRGTFVPPRVWHRPSSLKPGAISAVHPGNISLLLLRENKAPHIINFSTNWVWSTSRSGRFTLSRNSFYTLCMMSSNSVLMC